MSTIAALVVRSLLLSCISAIVRLEPTRAIGEEEAIGMRLERSLVGRANGEK